MRRILFLVARRSDVSVRFRVDQWRPHLERRGIASDTIELGARQRERWSSYRSARGYNAVIVHRALLGLPEIAGLRLFGGRYAFDFDDAIMHNDSSHPDMVSSSRARRVGAMTRHASSVIVGNRYLAEWAEPRSRGTVSVVPTTVDLDAYPSGSNPAPTDPVVGWIGTRVNLIYLESIAAALSRLGQRRPRAKLEVVCDAFPELDGIEVINKRWSLASEPADVRSFAVGLMPLWDDPWTRGKCSIKVLQCFAAARPVVCSPVGHNLEVVEHGRNGYFASSEEEWVDRLDELLGDDEKRRRMGEEGRRTVEERYSTAGNVDAFIAALGREA
jgi:glycosyltransferase involved in cell wall biosynthesis